VDNQTSFVDIHLGINKDFCTIRWRLIIFPLLSKYNMFFNLLKPFYCYYLIIRNLMVPLIEPNGPYNDFRNSNRTIPSVTINHKLPQGAYNSTCSQPLKYSNLCVIHLSC